MVYCCIVQVGTPSELITQPASDYIRAFTQDVNRAQVLKAGSIARQTITLILGQNSPSMALEEMLHHNLKQMYVVDQGGKLVGMVTKKFLEEAIRQGSEDLTSVMLQNFPQANASTRLENILHLYQEGLPVAVVDADEKFQGVIEASDVLASISSIQ